MIDNRIKNRPGFAPVTRKVRLASGGTGKATRWMRVVPPTSAATGPVAGPVTPLQPAIQPMLTKAPSGTEFDPVTGRNAGGWTRDGWHDEGWHFNLRFDTNGLDRDGYAIYSKPLDDYGFTPHGFDLGDFDRDGVHRDTGTPFNLEGRDRHSFGANGRVNVNGDPAFAGPHNIDGFLINGIHRVTGSEFDERGFDWNYIHRDTGTRFDERGFTRRGKTRDGTSLNAEGRDFRNCDSSGRDQAGNHFRTGTPLDHRGFDAAGVNAETGTVLDSDGWDVNKLRKNGRSHVGGRDIYGVRVR